MSMSYLKDPTSCLFCDIRNNPALGPSEILEKALTTVFRFLHLDTTAALPHSSRDEIQRVVRAMAEKLCKACAELILSTERSQESFEEKRKVLHDHMLRLCESIRKGLEIGGTELKSVLIQLCEMRIEQLTHMQALPEGRPMDEPQGAGSAEEPQGTGSAEEPQGAWSMDESQGAGSAEEPQGAGSMDEPKGAGSAEEPQDAGSMDEPQVAGSTEEPQGAGSAGQVDVGSDPEGNATLRGNADQAITSPEDSGVEHSPRPDGVETERESDEVVDASGVSEPENEAGEESDGSSSSVSGNSEGPAPISPQGVQDSSFVIGQSGRPPRTNCLYCKYKSTPTLTEAHTMRIHPEKYFGSQMPPGATTEQVEAAIDNIIHVQRLIRRTSAPRRFQCQLCRGIRPAPSMKNHLLSLHVGEVIARMGSSQRTIEPKPSTSQQAGPSGVTGQGDHAANQSTRNKPVAKRHARCPICGETFETKLRRKNHINRRHKRSQPARQSRRAINQK